MLKSKPEIPSPSGMSHATMAISARTHKMKFGILGYSFLQCSAKCFPATRKIILEKKISINTETVEKM
jgi:hypothetical protein